MAPRAEPMAALGAASGGSNAYGSAVGLALWIGIELVARHR
jgi:hypothetical protein